MIALDVAIADNLRQVRERIANAAIRAGRKPLPGRGLGDPDYRLPWGGRA